MHIYVLEYSNVDMNLKIENEDNAVDAGCNSLYNK